MMSCSHSTSTLDKDDETNAKIYDLAQQVAINTAVRPYQDKLIQCKIDEVYTSLVNYVDRKTCRLDFPGGQHSSHTQQSLES